jgi:Spy/CpxP family protein refolding chaperone
MNQPQGDRHDRWLKLSLATLVVLNLALLATVWVAQWRRPPAVERGGMGGRERDSAQQFLEQQLSLSEAQRESTVQLRAAHFQKTDALRKEINRLRRQLMEEVVAATPDRDKVARLASELGSKQGQVEMLTYDHFVALYALCQPAQQEKFRTMMSGLLDRLKPPPPNPALRGTAGDRAETERPAGKGATADAPDELSRTLGHGQDPGAEPAQRPAADMRRDQDEPGNPPGEGRDEFSRVANQLERLRTRLGLSADQVGRLQPVVEQFARQIDAGRTQAGGADAGRQQEKAIKDRRDEAIKALLTPTQQTEFERMKQEKRAGSPRPDAPPREN